MKENKKDILKIKKIKNIIMKSKQDKHNISSSLNFGNNNKLFPKITKNLLNKHINGYNSQRNIINPTLEQKNLSKSSNSTINIIDQSFPSRNQLNNNINKKSYNPILENSLNTTISRQLNFNKTLNKSCFEPKILNKNIRNLNEMTISNFMNNRKISKSKTQPLIFNKNSLPNINNNTYNNSISKIFFRKKNIPAKKIYEYYISQESKNIIKPIKNFDKFIKRKYRDPKKRFNKIYCINKSYLQRTKEIKNNKFIALKKDFDIDEYQNAILLFLQNRVDIKNLHILIQNYKDFNEKINRKFSPKGRFTNLANKIRNNAPTYLINKLKDLDKNKLVKRAKFLKTKIDLDNKKNDENKKENYFEEFDLYMENKYMRKIDKK